MIQRFRRIDVTLDRCPHVCHHLNCEMNVSSILDQYSYLKQFISADSDIDGISRLDSFREQLELIRKAGNASKIYDNEILDIMASSNRIEAIIDLHSEIVASYHMNMSATNEDIRKCVEFNLFRSLIEYSHILRQEIMNHRKKIDVDNENAYVRRLQCMVKRDLKLLHQSLVTNSNGKVSIQLLDPNSIQYDKCVRAFTDNIHPAIATVELEVINVARLEHKELSSLMKACLLTRSTDDCVSCCHISRAQ